MTLKPHQTFLVLLNTRDMHFGVSSVQLIGKSVSFQVQRLVSRHMFSLTTSILLEFMSGSIDWVVEVLGSGLTVPVSGVPSSPISVSLSIYCRRVILQASLSSRTNQNF